MPRPKTNTQATVNKKLTPHASACLTYLRDITLQANDQSQAIILATIRLTGSPEPWLLTNHIFAKQRGNQGKWIKKPGPKGAGP